MILRTLTAFVAATILAFVSPTSSVFAAAPDDFVAQQLSFRAIRAVEAWGYETGSEDVIVAILDSGIDANHPDLLPNLLRDDRAPAELAGGGTGLAGGVRGWDFVGDDAFPEDVMGRGTHLAGIIGAVGNNGMGVAGLAWNVRLLPVRVLERDPRNTKISPELGSRAIRYAADQGAGVILLTFRTDEDDPGLREAIRYAVSRDAVVIAAAGDRSRDLDRRPEYPAAWVEPGLISVTAADQGTQPALSSNYGRDSISMAAPGVNVFSTLPGALAGPMSGSAQAAAHVAGGVALLRSYKPSLSAVEIAEAVPRLSSNRNALADACRSGSILDLGLLIAEKRDTVEARITAPRRARVGEEVIFDATLSEGPIVEYLWKFGDPLDEFGPVVPRRWHRPGRVAVELIVRTFDGRTASTRTDIVLEGNDELSRMGCAVVPGVPATPVVSGIACAGAFLTALLLLVARQSRS